MRFTRRVIARRAAIRGQRQVPVPQPDPRRARLDALADEVAAALDRGCYELAWSRTRALEREADPGVRVDAEPIPPAPVIGRRFAAAHRRLLRAAEQQRPALRHWVA